MSKDARYDEVAEWYDATLSGDSPLATMPRETASRLLIPPTGRLLDIGCGDGSHTDLDAWPAALREARHVVRPGGPFVYVGVHPCS